MRLTTATAGLLLAMLVQASPAFGQRLLDRMLQGGQGGNDDGYYDDGDWDDGYYDDGYYDNGYYNNNGNWNGWNQNHQRPGWGYQPQRPQVIYSQQPIKISMPANEAGICGYVLGNGGQSWNYTIAPGKSQEFKEDRAWTLTYDRGNGFGQQSYNLKPGHYRFRQSSRGWELYRSDSMADAPVNQGPPPPM